MLSREGPSDGLSYRLVVNQRADFDAFTAGRIGGGARSVESRMGSEASAPVIERVEAFQQDGFIARHPEEERPALGLVESDGIHLSLMQTRLVSMESLRSIERASKWASGASTIGPIMGFQMFIRFLGFGFVREELETLEVQGEWSVCSPRIVHEDVVSMDLR